MGIPQGYAETESGSGAFASSDGSATLQVGFYDKAAGFPVYTLSDVEENAEKYVQYYIGLLESTNITKHEILSRGYREGSSLDTYLIQFSATESVMKISRFNSSIGRTRARFSLLCSEKAG